MLSEQFQIPIYQSQKQIEIDTKRLLHDMFHIGPGISPRLPYQARQRPYGKFHVIIFLSHILHWPFPSIDFYIAKKIYEQTKCENKSLRELPLFNLQIFLFRIWFQKLSKQCRSVQWRSKLFVKSTQDVDIWIEIPIQHDVYIWANYSVSSYSKCIPIYWNVLIWLKYDFMHIV